MTKQQIKAEIGLSRYANIDCLLAEFKASLDALAKHIGAGEEDARVYIEIDDCYDEYPSMEAYVWRPETDAEEAARMAEEAARAQANRLRYEREREAKERALLEELKAKYGA